MTSSRAATEVYEARGSVFLTGSCTAASAGITSFTRQKGEEKAFTPKQNASKRKMAYIQRTFVKNPRPREHRRNLSPPGDINQPRPRYNCASQPNLGSPAKWHSTGAGTQGRS